MTTVDTSPSVETLDALYALYAQDIDDDLVHMVRACDPDTALCGEPVPGEEYTEEDDSGPHCPECMAIENTGDTAHLAGCVVCRDTEGTRWW